MTCLNDRPLGKGFNGLVVYDDIKCLAIVESLNDLGGILKSLLQFFRRSAAGLADPHAALTFDICLFIAGCMTLFLIAIIAATTYGNPI